MDFDDEKGNRASERTLMRERELAERWGKSVRTLQRWRSERCGPAHIRLGSGVRYRLSDVLEFENRMRCEADDGASS